MTGLLATLGSLEFQWPLLLWLLLLLPVLAFAYARTSARRASANDHPLLETVGQISRTGARWLPALLVFGGLLLLIAALARPQAALVLPARMETIMLGIDISGSMRAGDVKPSRIAAAKEAAKSFIDGQPGAVRIGLIAIAGSAAVTQSPTRDREELYQALDRLQLQRGTALGSGLAIALATLLPEAGIDPGKIINGIPSTPPGGAGNNAETKGKPLAAPGSPNPGAAVAPGSNNAAAVVLLSDGSSNTGPDPLEVAKIAADHGVRVFTIGVGTPEGATLSTNGMSIRVRLDEEPLKKLANITSGEYFRAGSATDLKRIYQRLGNRMVLERRQITELSSVVALLGGLLLAAGAFVSLARHDRIL